MEKKNPIPSAFLNIPIDSSKIPKQDTIKGKQSDAGIWNQNGVWGYGWVESVGQQGPAYQVPQTQSPNNFMGTTGRSLRLEAYQLTTDTFGLNLQLDIMFPGGNWLGSSNPHGNPLWGIWIGTQGKSQATSAVLMYFINQPHFHIYYIAHMSSFGWQSWVGDGAVAGITGIRLEAVAYQILKY